MIVSDTIKTLINNTSCLEIGGPSPMFKTGNDLALYDVISPDFLIEKTSAEQGFGQDLVTNNKIYYGDCVNKQIWELIDKQYELILSSHVLEHIANPIKFLKLAYDKTSKYILTIVPDPRYMWDSSRPITTIEHLVQDFNNDTDENDITHLYESYIPGHPWYKHIEHEHKFFDNGKYRVLHHHTFSKESLTYVHEKVGFKSITIFCMGPHHLIYFGRKQ